MDPVATRLAQAQVKGHLAIDRVYEDLADAVEAEVLRHATTDADGAPRLSLSARGAILAAVALLLDRARPALIAAVITARQDAREAALVDQPPLPVDPIAEAEANVEIVRTIESNRPSVLRQLGTIVATGIALNLGAGEIAKRAAQYFSPFFAPRRNVAGQVVRSGRQGAIHHWPGRAGMASMHVRLVMLYQSAESHDAAIRRTAERDGGGMKWNLSGAHPKTDICDQHASRDSGLGPGVYLPGNYPKRPHPRCRCWASLVAVSVPVAVPALAGVRP